MAIHSTISKMKIRIQNVISPYSLDQFLISSTPWTRKRVKRGNKSNDSQIVVSRQFNFTRKSKGKFPSRRAFGFYRRIGRNHRINGLIAINRWGDTSFGESVRLSRERPITNRASRCVHVARVKRFVDSSHPLDLHLTISINRGVHRSRLIMTVITPQMDCQD